MVAYDAVVLGVGGVGSAALWHLARCGARVLGVDRFTPPHDRGSSHGQSRIIRQAYFEHPSYTPLLLESYRLWNELEEEVNRQLYRQVGVLQIGPAEGVVVPGVFQAADEHNLDVEQLSPTEIQNRWPGLQVPENLLGAFEPRAGYLKVEACVEAHLESARRAGAELRLDVEVYDWDARSSVLLHTSDGDISADRLIVAAGPWAGQLLRDLGVPLEVRRKSLFWYSAAGSESEASRLPGFLYELEHRVFYGLPQIDSRGIKLAEHSGGKPLADPLQINHNVDAMEQQTIEAFLHSYVPAAKGPMTDHSTCMYTMSPDGHFILDRLPEEPNVVFAAGLSGHGFKFAPVLGKALAELALAGETALPIEFLSLDRFLAASEQ